MSLYKVFLPLLSFYFSSSYVSIINISAPSPGGQQPRQTWEDSHGKGVCVFMCVFQGIESTSARPLDRPVYPHIILKLSAEFLLWLLRQKMNSFFLTSKFLPLLYRNERYCMTVSNNKCCELFYIESINNKQQTHSSTDYKMRIECAVESQTQFSLHQE